VFLDRGDMKNMRFFNFGADSEQICRNFDENLLRGFDNPLTYGRGLIGQPFS
jgi:hypothetical protein